MSSHIGTVIGWKFNHQPGMVTRDGVITEFPGGIPSQAEQDAWTAEYDALQPTRDWEAAMVESDDVIPRALEDIYDAMTDTQKAAVAQVTRDKIEAKKALRGQKP